jgi:hypothetical protein
MTKLGSWPSYHLKLVADFAAAKMVLSSSSIIMPAAAFILVTKTAAVGSWQLGQGECYVCV